jgi:DNA-binding response OmpR family regulator
MSEFKPQTYRILAVDDSSIILHLVSTSLKNAGFEVLTALSGEDALELIKKEGLPHLAIVDINIPFGMDGFEFCEAVLEFCDLPIIMLTAVDETEMVIQAIEQYAEDYITKPVSAGELVARVRRILRSVGTFAYPLTTRTAVDDYLSIDFANCRAHMTDQEITLTPTETKLLYILMRSSGRLLSTEFILKRLWPLESVFEDRLRVYVHRVRSKIEKDPTNPRYIVSKRRRGYIFLPNRT